jgi:hypothetical protein
VDQEFIYETQEEAEKALAEWQKRLKLEHWEVMVEIVRSDGMSKLDNSGEIDYQQQTGYASIRLLDHIDWPSKFPHDMEKILVHELLHLHFAPFEPEEESLQFTLWERANELLARVIVNEHRNAKTKIKKKK